MRTAPFFVAIHVPLLFAPGWTWTSVGISFAALALAAPFFRYLLGMHLLDTGGSLFAVGLQHAAFNGSGVLAAPAGPALNASRGPLLARVAPIGDPC